MQKTFLYIFASLLSLSSLSASAYEAQSLRPINFKKAAPSKAETESPAPSILGRTYNHYDGARVLAPKKKTYPFLDQLEYLLFPSLDFKKENPGKRLERLELAVFGEKQNGKIGSRLKNLESEVDSWQIANMQIAEKLSKPKSIKDNYQTNAFSQGEQRQAPSNLAAIQNAVNAMSQRSVRAQRRAPPISSQNYYPNSYQAPQNYNYQARQQNSNGLNVNRIVTPFINRLGSETINSIFR